MDKRILDTLRCLADKDNELSGDIYGYVACNIVVFTHVLTRKNKWIPIGNEVDLKTMNEVICITSRKIFPFNVLKQILFTDISKISVFTGSSVWMFEGDTKYTSSEDFFAHIVELHENIKNIKEFVNKMYTDFNIKVMYSNFADKEIAYVPQKHHQANYRSVIKFKLIEKIQASRKIVQQFHDKLNQMLMPLVDDDGFVTTHPITDEIKTLKLEMNIAENDVKTLESELQRLYNTRKKNMLVYIPKLRNEFELRLRDVSFYSSVLSNLLKEVDLSTENLEVEIRAGSIMNNTTNDVMIVKRPHVFNTDTSGFGLFNTQVLNLRAILGRCKIYYQIDNIYEGKRVTVRTLTLEPNDNPENAAQYTFDPYDIQGNLAWKFPEDVNVFLTTPLGGMRLVEDDETINCISKVEKYNIDVTTYLKPALRFSRQLERPEELTSDDKFLFTRAKFRYSFEVGTLFRIDITDVWDSIRNSPSKTEVEFELNNIKLKKILGDNEALNNYVCILFFFMEFLFNKDEPIY